MPKSEQNHVERLRRQGRKLAQANKQCAGTSNKHGEFYRCVKKKLEKVFK